MTEYGNWFYVRKIDENTFAISEPHHWEETNCYLLIGKEKAMFIDTGLGVCNISEAVRKLTNKPVFAALTHVHWDHIGGLRNFSEFYVHELEKDWIDGKFPLPTEFVRKMLVKDNSLTDIANIDNYAVFQGKPFGFLKDGDVIDLGGRKIKVFHTPGHSPGHMCFFEEETGYLFSGDLIYKGTLYANYESTDPDKYFESVQRISELPAKRIFPGHHSLDISPEIVCGMLKGLSGLKEKGLLCHGNGKFDFGDWSILM